jgi:aminomethyltransferase
MSDPIAHKPAELALTPLHALHVSRGARMVPFAGYDMPVHYPTGILAEHLHTRQAAGLFDVSHMGQAELAGIDAARRLEALVPGDIAALEIGRMRYTQLLDADGNILDDLMVTKLPPQGDSERLLLVVNAATKTQDFAHIKAALPELVLSVFADRALLALQGPQAAAVLARRMADNTPATPSIATMSFMSWQSIFWQSIAWRGETLFVTRSGYTGEDGFEISVPAARAVALAEDLLAEPEVWPIGLGARDSLRLEAGLCLYGHDIDQTTNPIEAGLAWSISKRRRAEGGFPGAARIQHLLADGAPRRRVGIRLDGKAPAREGADIVTLEGAWIGRLTSGGYAPSLGCPIGMGYVAAVHATVGTKVNVVVRGKSLAAEIVSLPFVPNHYYRGT